MKAAAAAAAAAAVVINFSFRRINRQRHAESERFLTHSIAVRAPREPPDLVAAAAADTANTRRFRQHRHCLCRMRSIKRIQVEGAGSSAAARVVCLEPLAAWCRSRSSSGNRFGQSASRGER